MVGDPGDPGSSHTGSEGTGISFGTSGAGAGASVHGPGPATLPSKNIAIQECSLKDAKTTITARGRVGHWGIKVGIVIS